MNLLCSCSLEVESTEHYFLRCHNFVTFSATFMNELNSIDSKFSTKEPDELVRTILYRVKKFDNVSNFKILTATINFIKNINDLSKLFIKLINSHLRFNTLK